MRVILDLQTIIKQAHQEWKENPQKAKEEQEVISKYGKMFNPKNIDNLTAKDFQSFLNFKNNKHWKSLERLGPEITRDMEKFKKTLKLLLDESVPIDERIKRIRDNKSSEYHKGFGSAYYTPVLLMVYPDKYPIINKIVKDALEKIKLYPDYNSQSEWIAYKEIIPMILELAEKNQLSLWQMDWVWWHVYSTLDYEGLYNFITKIMDAKSTYQPIMIRTLLEKGTASKETIDEIIRLENPEKDKKFVSNEVYEVLIDKHNIVKEDENGYKLNLLQPLTSIEQDKLVKLCNQEIISIREKQSHPPLLQVTSNYWIFIVSDQLSSEDDQPKLKLSAEEIYQTRMNDKFWGLGKRTRYRKQLKKGDLVVFCYKTKKFLGTAKLDTDCFEPNEEQKIKLSHGLKFYMTNYGVMLSDITIWQKPKEVSQDIYQFPKYFQGGINKIQAADYNLITGKNLTNTIDTISEESSYISQDKETTNRTNQPNLWLVRAGERGEGAQTALEKNCVGIGYDGLPDLHLIKDFELFKEQYKKTHPKENTYRIGQVIPQIWNFMYEINTGDFVILPLAKHSKLIAVGKILSEYQYADLHSEIKQFRSVHWLKKDVNVKEFDSEIQQSLDARGTIRLIQGLDVVDKLKSMLKRLGVNEADLEDINYTNSNLSQNTYNKTDYYKENKWLSLTDFDIKDIIKRVLTAEEDKRLEINENIVKRIITHLVLSKHVILVGPPGTGKTDLARRILRELGNKIIGNPDPIEAVASYEWGRYEVIGGRSITSNEVEGSFHFGCVTNAMYKKRLLLIDEFNRADMNKAFGELFLALDHGEIHLRDDEYIPNIDNNHKIQIPTYFRMICTMNDYDKSLLNELSYGLLRRFAFVEINVPDNKEKVKNIVIERTLKKLQELDKNLISVRDKKIDQFIDKFIDFMFSLKLKREIGLSSYIDVVSYFLYSSSIMKTETDVGGHLNNALIDYILPQFDRLDIETLRLAYKEAQHIFQDENKDENRKINESKNPFLLNLKKRIERLEDLNKLFKFGESV